MPTAFCSLKNETYEKYGIWSEMGPYGSVWANIKTGRSPMAHDHFWTPPDPKKGAPGMKEAEFTKVCPGRLPQLYIYGFGMRPVLVLE